MDQKLLVCFEVKKNDRVYSLHVPSGAPLGEVYDSLHELLMKVTELAKQSAEQTKPADAGCDNPVEAELVDQPQ